MALLEVRNVTRRFGGLVAVKSVYLEVEPGQIFGIIGPNGAGKSTLFNVIAGAMAPSEGEVYFDGREINGLPPHAVCRLGVARTFQIVRPMKNMTVLDNVVVGAMAHGGSVAECLTHARHCISQVGLAEVVHQPAGGLSIGHRKRLELARALATRPKLLLLDEVMGGLTSREVDDLVRLVREIRDSGITVVFIEHIMKAVMALSEFLVVLHHGEKIAEGAPQEVAGNEAVIDAYLGTSHAAD